MLLAFENSSTEFPNIVIFTQVAVHLTNYKLADYETDRFEVS